MKNLSIIGKVGLKAKADLYPSQLSGGQQQRVGIARALAVKPDIILLDEPTSALDPELVGEVLQALKMLAQEGWTMIIVTHELNFAKDVADRVILMENGQVVEQNTASEFFSHPQQSAPNNSYCKLKCQWNSKIIVFNQTSKYKRAVKNIMNFRYYVAVAQRFNLLFLLHFLIFIYKGKNSQ